MLHPPTTSRAAPDTRRTEIAMTTPRRLLAAALASGLLLGATPAVGQADAASLKSKAVEVEKKGKVRATLRKL